jgi:hypothetical protein
MVQAIIRAAIVLLTTVLGGNRPRTGERPAASFQGLVREKLV